MKKYLDAIKLICGCLVLVGQVALAGVIGGRDQPGPVNLGQTTANTLTVNADGIGHILLLPYYSAQGGNATILSLTNTDYLNGKAVKVRFRGATNGDSVLDLTVFLAPNDVWNGLVSQDPSTGSAQLTSADSSCTLPSLSSGNALRFSGSRLRPGLSSSEAVSHTLEGYVELMTMANIPALGTVAATAGSLFKSISRQATGGVRACNSATLLATQVETTSEAAAAAQGFATPTTGIQGSWTIVNVPRTLTFSGDALAIEARDSSGLPARANFVFFAQSTDAASNVDSLTADPMLRLTPLAAKTAAGVATAYVPQSGSLPIVKAVWSDFPDISTPYLEGASMPTFQAAQLSKIMAVKSVINEYATEPGIGAASDWVLSMPARRYSVGADFRQSQPVLVYSLVTAAGNAEYFSSANSSVANGLICTLAEDQTFFDREAAGRHQPAGSTNPQAVTPLSLCGTVPVLKFANESALAASVSVVQAGAASVSGWATLNTKNSALISAITTTTGIPLIGASFIKASNPVSAPGVSGNYGIVSPHSFSR